jgi:hypothetical protein
MLLLLNSYGTTTSRSVVQTQNDSKRFAFIQKSAPSAKLQQVSGTRFTTH